MYIDIFIITNVGALGLEDVLHEQYFTFITAEVHLHFQCVSCLKPRDISKKLD